MKKKKVLHVKTENYDLELKKKEKEKRVKSKISSKRTKVTDSHSFQLIKTFYQILCSYFVDASEL